MNNGDTKLKRRSEVTTMYMNRFIFGSVMGMIVGALAVWYVLSSDKDKKKVYRTLKNIIP